MNYRKKVLSVLIVMILSIGITAKAATCPACDASHVHAECRKMGQLLNNNTYQHSKAYSEGGVLKYNRCTVVCLEEKVSWVCPYGHGIISTITHYQEMHTCSYCTDLDYYK